MAFIKQMAEESERNFMREIANFFCKDEVRTSGFVFGNMDLSKGIFPV
jgi:hypothetical protein